MAQYNWQTGQLSGHFRIRHIVALPQLRSDLLQNLMIEEDKLRRVQYYANTLYLDSLDANHGINRWRAHVMPLQQPVTLILSDKTTVLKRLREGYQINDIPIKIQAEGKLPMVRVRITSHDEAPDPALFPTVNVEWAYTGLGSYVTYEKFGAYFNLMTGEFDELFEIF